MHISLLLRTILNFPSFPQINFTPQPLLFFSLLLPSFNKTYSLLGLPFFLFSHLQFQDFLPLYSSFPTNTFSSCSLPSPSLRFHLPSPPGLSFIFLLEKHHRPTPPASPIVFLSPKTSYTYFHLILIPIKTRYLYSYYSVHLLFSFSSFHSDSLPPSFPYKRHHLSPFLSRTQHLESFMWQRDPGGAGSTSATSSAAEKTALQEREKKARARLKATLRRRVNAVLQKLQQEGGERKKGKDRQTDRYIENGTELKW